MSLAKVEMHRRVDERFEEMWKVYEVSSSQINELGEKMLAAKEAGNQRKSYDSSNKLWHVVYKAWVVTKTSDSHFKMM